MLLFSLININYQRGRVELWETASGRVQAWLWVCGSVGQGSWRLADNGNKEQRCIR